jgi:hypothetical protein
MSSGFDILVNSHQRDAEKHMDRAMHFYEKDDYQQALKDFAISFESYIELCALTERAGKTFYKEDEKMSCLSTLGSYLAFIINSFVKIDKPNEAGYLTLKFKALVRTLSQNESNLTVDDLESLGRFKKNLISFKDSLGEDLEVHKDLVSNDTEFSMIQSSLNKICRLKVCPLEPSNSSSSSDSCFIATAAYQTSSHADLDTFREFRDRRLLPTYLGRQLVVIYYRLGPKAATIVAINSSIQRRVRKALEVTAILMRKLKITAC